MNFPPGLLAAASLFWGQQSGLWGAAAVLALMLEGPRVIARRWDLTPAHFGRISDLSAVFFLALAVFAYLTTDPSRAFAKLTVWLPLVYAPLALGQLYSADGRIALSALFLFLRKGKHEWSTATIDLVPLFFVLCLLSAAAANVRTPAFYAGMTLLTALALWPAKPSGSSRLIWTSLLVAAGGLGWTGQFMLGRLQDRLERAAAALVAAAAKVDPDAQRALTAMGHVGKLKQSDEVVLRAWTPRGTTIPPLLRLAAYNRYAGLQWLARNSDLQPVKPAAPSAWSFAPEPRPARVVDVSLQLSEGTGVLALPGGTARLEGVPAANLVRNRLGAVQAQEAPELVTYRAVFGGRDAAGADRDDLSVPAIHAKLFGGLAQTLKLDARRPRAAMTRIAAYFNEEFEYSVYRGEDDRFDPLTTFMTVEKKGHCEHFATATVLLLRAAGISARYVTGYSMQEYSSLESAFIARGRHAHAWALTRIDGAWVDFDTTPPIWTELETGRASWFLPVRDMWAWASYRVAAWWWGSGGTRKEPLVALLLAALAFLAWRLVRDFGRPAAVVRGGAGRGKRAGLDSEFFRLEHELERRGFGRRSSETVSGWLARLSEVRTIRLPLVELRAAADLHERYRFDPAGLDEDRREALKVAAARAEAVLAAL